MEEEKIIEARKEKIKSLFKNKTNLIVYAILAILVFLVVRIRTLNIPGLRDISNGEITLGPDLDPFLFLRWAKTIVAEGSLPVIDMMRYVPLGFDIKGEYILHPYMMAWFHKFASIFGSESVTQSSVIYPVFFFALTTIVFFFLVRETFKDGVGLKKANIIALISTFFLGVSPTLLPRTIAGIPEKESAAFFFLFAAFFFFIKMWKEQKFKRKYLFAVLAGLATAGMALIWGGYLYIFVILVPAVFVYFLLNKIKKEEIIAYSIWMFLAFVLISPFKNSYTISGLISSISTGSAVLMLFIIFVDYVIHKTRFKRYFNSEKIKKIPPRFLSLIISVVLAAVLSSLVFGISFVPNKLRDIVSSLGPTTSRLIQTVAENRQPYFEEWVGSFGPYFSGFPIFFWIFLFGSIYLFANMIKHLHKKEKIVLTSSYVFFLFSIIFSKFSADSVLNGENTLSVTVYILGLLVFAGTLGYYYFKHFKSETLEHFGKIDFGILLLFLFFFFGIISARAAVRTIMVLVPPVSMIVSYFAVSLFYKAKNEKRDDKKIISWVIALIIIIPLAYAGLAHYETSSQSAKAFVPSSYNQQWQLAMSWVRENTQENAVFGHWWDYGYWLQSIGERATILDGGNAISYWNHLMGRYVLTGQSSSEAAEFLYAHNATHLLIDSTDIGKYGAFSFIGSDENLDRRSSIGTFLKNEQNTQETKNSTIFFFTGGVGLDEDVIYQNGNNTIFLPSGKAGIGAIIVTKNKDGNFEQPLAVFVFNGQQYTIPLRYIFNGEELEDFGSGIESGVFIFPRIVQESPLSIDREGALLYLNERTVKSQLARLYLYEEDNSYFRLAHSEDDIFINQIKQQNPEYDEDFLFYQGLRGPIRIWEINYPGIEFDERFLETKYPDNLGEA